MPRTGQQAAPCPPLLKCLYGEERVVPLRDLLLALSRLSRNAAHLGATLVQPHDHRDYAQRLLGSTLCVVNAGAPALRDGFSLQQMSNQAELVARAVEAMLRSQQASDNVLAYGYRKKRPAPGGRQLGGMSTAEAYHPNTVTAMLMGPPWQLLLSRIGDTLMLYLLMHTSLFARLPNNCVLQLSGPPLQAVVRRWRAEAAGGGAGRAGGGAARDANCQVPLGPAVQPAAQRGQQGVQEPAAAQEAMPGDRRQRAAAGPGLASLLATQAPSGNSLRVTAATEPAAGASGAGGRSGGQAGAASPPDTVIVQGASNSQQQQQGGGRVKQPRPSSWQRRKAAAQRAAQQAQRAAQQALTGEEPGRSPAAAPTQLAGGSPPAGAPSTQLVEEAVQPRGSSQNTDAAAAAVAVASDAAAFAAAEASPGPHGGVQLSQRPSPQEAEAAEPSPAELPCVPMDCSPAEPCPPVAQPANGNCAPAMETTGQGPALNLPGGTAPVQLARQPAQQHHEQQAALQPPGARQLQPGQPAQARRRSGPVAAWPARMPRPTDMLIQRSGVFYCASFPPRPGFPAKHILRALHGEKGAARRLLAAIFDPRHNPVGRAGNAHMAAHRTLPPAPRRVAAWQRQLVPLMHKMLERARKLPYSILLNRHCPLPEQLRHPARRRATQQRRQQEQEQQQEEQQLADAPPPSQAPPAGPSALPGAAPPQPPLAAADLDQLMDELHQLHTTGLAAPAAGRGGAAGEPGPATVAAAAAAPAQTAPAPAATAAPAQAAPAALPDLDSLMDELFSGEDTPVPAVASPAPAAAPAGPAAPTATQQQLPRPPRLDSLLDELFACEQQPQHTPRPPATARLSSPPSARTAGPAAPSPTVQLLQPWPNSLPSPENGGLASPVERRKRTRQWQPAGSGPAGPGGASEPWHQPGYLPAQPAEPSAEPGSTVAPAAAEPAAQAATAIPDSEDQEQQLLLLCAQDRGLPGALWSLPATQAADGEGAASQQAQRAQRAERAQRPCLLGSEDAAPTVLAGPEAAAAAAVAAGGTMHLGSGSPAAATGSTPVAPAPTAPGPQQPPSCAALASEFVPHTRVAAFVWSVLRRLLPAPLLGGRHNRARLRAAVRRFVGLRRYEQMSVHQAMQGMRVTHFAWLRAPLPRAPPSAQQPEATAAAPGVHGGVVALGVAEGEPRLAEVGGSEPPAGLPGAMAWAGRGPARAAQRARRQQQGGDYRTPREHRPPEQQPEEQSQPGRDGNLPRPRPASCPSLHGAQQRRLALWLGWLLSVVVAPLLRAHFYCTESEAYRQKVFYYRKPVWARLAQGAVRELQGSQFTPVPRQQAQATLQARKLGVARLRLLPKRTGMRFIANLGCSTTVVFPGAKPPARCARWGALAGVKRPRRLPPVKLCFKPVNFFLQNIYQVLKLEAGAQGPEVLGASVFGHNDAYCRLQPFIRNWRAATAARATAAAPAAPAGTPAVAAGSPGASAATPQQAGGAAMPSSEGPRGRAQCPTPAAGTAAAGGSPGRGTSIPQPYLVSVDVTRAFDNVDIPLLLGLVQPLLRHEEYLVLKYTEVVPSVGGVKLLYRRVALPAAPGATPNFPALAHRLAQSFRGKAFVDQVVYDRVSRQAVLALLQQHLTANLVKLRREWHRQARGIAQGSTLSTLLCSIYLAHIERTHLRPLIVAATAGAEGPPSHSAAATHSLGTRTTSSRGLLTALAVAAGEGSCLLSGGAAGSAGVLGPLGSPPGSSQRVAAPLQQAVAATLQLTPPAGGTRAAGAVTPAAPAAAAAIAEQQPGCGLGPYRASLLLRLVDDFLLVTSVPGVAAAVAERMLQGFPEANVFVNPHKTKLSFGLAGPGGRVLVPASLHRAASGAAFVKWCGLLINVASLEVQGDYTRYAGEHISASLTLPLRKRPGAALGPKLCQYLRPKIHPLLLDAAINSQSTILLNIYQAFLLGAMKFHCYVAALPAPPAPSAGVLLEAIERGIGFMHGLTRRRRVRPAADPSARAVTCIASVSKAQIRWLGLHAFNRVLRRKPARYSALLRALGELLEAPASRQLARALAGVLDNQHSDVFQQIRY